MSTPKVSHSAPYPVPAIIVAYNIFTNAVDWFDQFLQTNSTERREKRVTMSILTFYWMLQSIMLMHYTKNFKSIKTSILKSLNAE